MRLLKDNLFKGRDWRSNGCPDSSRRGASAGAGDEGRLEGRKREGVLSTFIMKKDLEVFILYADINR